MQESNKKAVREVLSGLRKFEKLCEERENIMYERALPDPAAISEQTAKVVHFCCWCFEKRVERRPRKATGGNKSNQERNRDTKKEQRRI